MVVIKVLFPCRPGEECLEGTNIALYRSWGKWFTAMRSSGFRLEVPDEFPDMVCIYPAYFGGEVIPVEEIMESGEETCIPLNGFWALILCLT